MELDDHETYVVGGAPPTIASWGCWAMAPASPMREVQGLLAARRRSSRVDAHVAVRVLARFELGKDLGGQLDAVEAALRTQANQTQDQLEKLVPMSASIKRSWR